ncbi:MAG: hypothetical protein K6L81_16175 [Agarilytica sp.]
MRSVLFLIGFLVSLKAVSLSKVPPYEIPLSKAKSYGVELKRVVGEEKTVIYLRFNKREFCPVESVQLNEKYMVVGERKRYLSKYGDAFTASFDNSQEYDEIRFIITCSAWHKKIPTGLFSLVIGRQDA